MRINIIFDCLNIGFCAAHIRNINSCVDLKYENRQKSIFVEVLLCIG